VPRADPRRELALDWSRFDEAFLPASLVAAQIVERLLAAGEVPEPAQLAPDTASQVGLRLRLRALSDRPLPPAVAAYASRVGDQVLGAGGGVDTPEEAAVTGALAEVDALLGQAIAAEDAGAPEVALEALARAQSNLDAIGRPASRRKRIDVEDYLALIEAARGRSCIAAGRHDEAERALWAIVELRERSDDNNSNLLADIIAYVDRCGARNPDRALTRLIPLVRHRFPGLAAAQRFVLLMTLADLYRVVGDIEAARHIVDDAAGMLADASLPLPEASATQAVVDALVALAVAPRDGVAPTTTERDTRFASVLTALLKRANILRQAAGNDADTHLGVIQRLTDVSGAAFERMAALAARPDPDLEHVGQAIAETGLPLQPALSPLPVAPLDLGASRRYGVLSERAESEGSSESLAAELEALADATWLQPALAAQALADAAGMRAGLGDEAAAAAGYQRAAKVAHQADDLWQEIQAVMGLVLLSDAARPPETKRADLRALIGRIEARRARLNAAYLPSAFMSDKVMPYLVAAHLAGKSGDHAERLRLMERLRAFEIHGPPLSDPVTDTLRREVTVLSDRLRAEADPQEAARLRIERRLAWDELMIARPRERPDFDLVALQARLGQAVVLSTFFFAPEVLDVTLITAREVIQVRRMLAEWPDLAARIAAATQPSRLDLHFASRLESLAEVLLPEQIRPALTRATEIAIAPHRDLHGLPWGALPLNGQPLILGKPLAMVPNLTVLTRRARPTQSLRSFFGIGTRETAEIDGEGRRLIDLAHAEAEVASAAAHFPQAATLIGEEATLAAFLADARLREAGVLLIALHGKDVADPSLARAPMETTLALRDGPIDGIDLACLPLAARLVVATACFSGRRAARLEGMESLPADALYGLQAAFFLAGAEAVVAALWKAYDSTAVRISDHLFKALAQGARPAEALHRAVRAYLATPGLRRVERDPYAWAPYAVTAFSPTAFAFHDIGET
jgi:CHAT domain-containing protein